MRTQRGGIEEGKRWSCQIFSPAGWDTCGTTTVLSFRFSSFFNTSKMVL